jgi:transcriptional regulator with XRE-family HTH domain
MTPTPGPTPQLGSLGEFLYACRGRLTPDDVGLAIAGRRRVPGLRREEIAMLAGVSPSYYTRLEQGQAPNASAQVIDALSRAMRLSDAEREHLHRLAHAGHTRPAAVEPAEETVDASLAELLDTVGDAPAMVFGRRRDILAWNPTGHALFAGHLDPGDVDDPRSRPNATELVFLDPHTRELYVDWPDKAVASVGHLRILASQYPNDARLLALIGRLAVDSAEFAAMWAANTIRPSQSAVYRMRHPLVGRLTITQQLLTTTQAPGQTLVICSAPRHSPSAEALSLLARTIRD